METASVREKHHRLSRENYVGYKCAAFTLCIKDRVPMFRNEKIAQAVLVILQNLSRDLHVCLWVALLMPDHAHLLLEGTDAKADLWAFIVRFKQRSGYLFSKKRVAGRWQKDFYDHIMRKDEEMENHTRYILENPVRSELADHWMQYPHKISTALDLTRPL
jgi:REP element-mobilizing transposase RayT